LKLVGFGCSFTYGSELQSPDVSWDRHRENTRYREQHSWLGCLATRFNCVFDNLAQPANSNYAIQYQVTDYINNTWKTDEQIIICVAWTEPARFSWLDTIWVHNGFISNEGETKFTNSHKEWLVSSVDHNYWTDAAKLNVNAVCKYHNIPILQFNAIGKHSTTTYPNYFLDGATMQSVLHPEHFASGGHPNELGHEWFTKRLYLFAKERIIV